WRKSASSWRRRNGSSRIGRSVIPSRLGKHAVLEFVEDLDFGHLVVHVLLLVLVDLSLGRMLQAGKEQALSGHFLGLRAARFDQSTRRGLALGILVLDGLEQGLVWLAVPEGNGCQGRTDFSCH